MPNDKDRPRRRGGDERQRARRDVRATFAPQFSTLERQGEQAESEADQYRTQVAQLYASLAETLGGLGGQYQAQLPGIQQGLQTSLGELTGMLGGTPAGEQAAAAGAFGQIGAGGLERLASAGQRGLSYNTSALRQSAIDATNYQTAVLQDLQQFRDALASQRTDLAAQMAPLVLSRMDELRDRAAELAQRNREFRLSKQLAEQQFGLQERQFGLQRRESRTGRRSDRAARQFFEDQAQTALDRRNRPEQDEEPFDPDEARRGRRR